MSIPETTSAEAFERYVGGKCLAVGQGQAWRDIKAWMLALPAVVERLYLPSVSEPFLAWTMSGEVDFQEREDGQPWITNRIKKGSFFLTSGGAPYECRWQAVTLEPFQSMAVFLELPLLQRALDEIFGTDAGQARLQDLSAFTDETLDSLMEQLRGRADASASKSSSGAGHGASPRGSSCSPLRCGGRRIAQQQPVASRFQAPSNHGLMSEHVADEFDLGRREFLGGAGT
jgi:hypothetical protein